MYSAFPKDFLVRYVSLHENFSPVGDLLEQNYTQKTTKNLNIKLKSKSVKTSEGEASICNHLIESEGIPINCSKDIHHSTV